MADRLSIERDSTLVAEGAVEVFHEGRRLTARRIVFLADEDRLAIEGPITLSEDGGRAILVADAASLDRDLREGILRSARLVFDRQLQLAAAEIARSQGRYTTLSRVVASSCRICPGSPTPLWEVRAARVVHDAETRQLTFERAQFRLGGVPIAYIPRLRLPDPAVERATGFLVPSLRFNSTLGTGPRVPYFVTLGRSADITLAPYVTPRTRTLEFRYRQAFRNGAVQVAGAVSDDDLAADDPRGYVFAEGAFALPRDFDLAFEIEATSDDDYLLDYGYSDDSRLESELRVGRTRRDERIAVSATAFDTLREDDRPGAEAPLATYARADYDRRVPLRWGELDMRLDAAALQRSADDPATGRDTARLGASLGWRGSRLLRQGVILEGRGEVGADTYRIHDDPAFDASETLALARGTLALRWPLVRVRGGVHETLEPVIQLGWGARSDGRVPNDDSRLVEFDEGNLFALGRFPGRDRVEEGTRLDLGLTYTRLAPGGREFGVTVGRILRFGATDRFDETTGLAGDASDWLASAHFDLGERLSVANRALLTPDLALRTNELRLAYDGDAADLTAAHLWLRSDPFDGRGTDVNEMTFDAGWRMGRHWRAGLDGRYDLAAGRAARAGLDLSWRNECMRVDVSLSRRFTSSTSVEPQTDIGVEVSLLGFGARDDDPSFRRSCPG